MPLPEHAQVGTGAFPIDGSLGIKLEGYTEPRLVHAQQRFLDRLAAETGIPMWGTRQNKPNIFISTGGPSAKVQKLDEDESYQLTVSPSEVHLRAANPLGVLHGLQTILQLVQVSPTGFVVPAVEIHDSPRFPWRGLMIDSGRHFMPLDVVERDLDGMEAVKLNVLHWHLSEDQGFRVESTKYPLLQQDGSDGLYYTQAQIRDLIAYASDRGIRVVPEFDMPCHTTAWFPGYPQLASGKGPYTTARQWGVLDPAMDPTRDSTYNFLDGFIGEMAALFPDAYFHIGGDECDGKEWNANPSIQRFMQAHQLKDNATLQAYFTGKIQKIVARHGKIMEGWDEVLQPDTPKDVVIQSWRGPQSLADAAHRGYRTLLSTGYYIDLNQSAAQHYAVDPLAGAAASLTPEEQHHILGGEAAMWSEYVTPENMDTRIWPRTAAIAERLWSPQDVQDVASMYRRLDIVSQKLEYYGLQPKSISDLMLRRMAGNADPAPLRVLASVVQPPQGYSRGALTPYTSLTPLNHLVDAVPPESDEARRFLALVQRLVAGNATPQDWQQARESLTTWRDNDAKLQPILPLSDLTKELSPLSANLREVAEMGLQSLDQLQNHQSISAAERDQKMAFLKNSQKPQAVLLNKIAPAVATLVEAVSPR
ncbi:MAG TPA: family 20 glycosylhydrolase [Acidisarcina sp.]|nr:family 20 glycosylhydrolase [Acidisarcina sp.]